MGDLKKQLAKVRKTRDYENLRERLGKPLGTALYSLVEMSDRADKELDIVHDLLTKLYEYDEIAPLVKECLSKIDALK